MEKQTVSDVVVKPLGVHDSADPFANAAIAYGDEAVVENQGRLRRLFSFVQLLAFALTFMSSWEVVAMLVRYLLP